MGLVEARAEGEGEMNEPIPMWLQSRLTMYDFVLEVMLANELAVISVKESQEFKSDLLSSQVQPTRHSGSVDLQVLKALNEMLRADLSNFLEKVAAREQDIRHNQ